MPIRVLSDELKNKAENELNETSSRIDEDLQQIREWLMKQPHLNPRTDDQWLLSFLRGSKFSLQRAKEKLDYFYTMRTLATEFFENRDPLLPEIQEILNYGLLLPLPKTAHPDSPRLLLLRWGNSDPDKIHYRNICKVYLMCLDILMNEDDNCGVAGVSILADMKGFSLNHVLQCTPALLKKLFLCVENAYPIRTKHLEYLNSPSAVEALFKIALPFFSEKLKSRVLIHKEGGIADAYNNFPADLLPTEYGGDNGSIAELTAVWKKKIESYREWFLEDAKFRTNEELRPGKENTSAELFGVKGTFRKLAID